MLAMRFCAPLTTLTELSILEPHYVLAPLLEPYPQLCSNILNLKLEGWHIESFGQLPRSLTCFTFMSLVPETPIGNVPARVELTDLPSGLIRLMITYITSERQAFTGAQLDFVGHFPNGSLPLLTHLLLPRRMVLDVESIKHLPRSLKSLVASIQWKGVPSSCLASLPPNLVSTKLDELCYRFEDLGDHWPPTAWRGLVGTTGADHIPRLLERLH